MLMPELFNKTAANRGWRLSDSAESIESLNRREFVRIPSDSFEAEKIEKLKTASFIIVFKSVRVFAKDYPRRSPIIRLITSEAKHVSERQTVWRPR